MKIITSANANPRPRMIPYPKPWDKGATNSTTSPDDMARSAQKIRREMESELLNKNGMYDVYNCVCMQLQSSHTSSLSLDQVQDPIDIYNNRESKPRHRTPHLGRNKNSPFRFLSLDSKSAPTKSR